MIFGMTSVRNESYIISDTLDNWAEICDGGIWVYGDDPHDATPALARSHPAVKEFIDSNLYDEDRARMEWYKRQMLYNSLLRFANPLKDWVAIFDADEHLDHDSIDKSIFEDTNIGLLKCRWWDVYITPEDEHLSNPRDFTRGYLQRQWVSPVPRVFPGFMRIDPRAKWFMPNQHVPTYDVSRGMKATHGDVKHWTHGFSVENHDRKVAYYKQEWSDFADTKYGNYAERAQNHEGRAVRTDYTDFDGRPLVRYAARLAGHGSEIGATRRPADEVDDALPPPAG